MINMNNFAGVVIILVAGTIAGVLCGIALYRILF